MIPITHMQWQENIRHSSFKGAPKMSTLNISIENGNVVSRFNGEGEGTIICSYVSDKQVTDIINAHNESETINPTPRNAKAVLA